MTDGTSLRGLDAAASAATSTDASLASAGSSETRLALPARSVVVAAALLLAIFVAVFSYFFKAQILKAVLQPSDWGHLLVIPAISAYFVWLKREELQAEVFRPAWSGLIPILLGMGIYFIGYLGPKSLLVHTNARGAGVGLTLFGVVLLVCGWRVLRLVWFPLLYLVVFGQAISDGLMKPITELLQDVAAYLSFITLAVFGIDVERDGNVITVFAGGTPKPLNVAEACSGMRMLIAFLALGVAIAHTGLGTWWQKTALVLSGVPIALGVNVLRVVTLGVLALWDINFAGGEFHHVIGLLWLLPGLLFYLGVLWILRHLVIEDGVIEDDRAPKEIPDAR